jgi:uncharacterized protein YgbK (DUF1537 family)
MSIGDLTRGKEHMIEKINAYREEGARIIVFDAITQEDIELCADAIIESKIPFVAVDPGVFTATAARKLIDPVSDEKGKRILVAIGSVNAVTRTQVKQFLLSQPVYNVYIEVSRLLEGEEQRDAEIKRVAEDILKNGEGYDVCSIIGVGIIPERRVPFEPYMERWSCSADELSRRINDGIAVICETILQRDGRFAGLYTSGGDITVSVCRRFKTIGLRLLSEVVPLAAYGELMGGSHEGLKIVTKGGMVGDENALITCVHYLKEKLLI